jgi:hypothetical protein
MTVERKKTYGRMTTGELITDELIERFVKKAEEGYDVEELRGLEPEGKARSSPADSHGQMGRTRSSRRQR